MRLESYLSLAVSTKASMQLCQVDGLPGYSVPNASLFTTYGILVISPP
jgi:hypothetical protein